MEIFTSNFNSQLEAIHALGCCTGLNIRREMRFLAGGSLSTRKALELGFPNQRVCTRATCFSKSEYFIRVYNVYEHRAEWAYPASFINVSRFAPIVGDYADLIVSVLSNTPYNERVLADIPDWVFNQIDSKDYRAEYAARIYKLYASPIDLLPPPERIHVCKDPTEFRYYDIEALHLAAEALGVRYSNAQMVSFIGKKCRS